MSTRDSSLQLAELYSAQLSPALISEVTDLVSEDVKALQRRLLDELYPIAYCDALDVNIKVARQVSKRAVYVVLGLNRGATKTCWALGLAKLKAKGPNSGSKSSLSSKIGVFRIF